MPRYEVELQIDATLWMDVEADDENEAIEYARKTYLLADVQYHDVIDASVKTYAEKDDAS